MIVSQIAAMAKNRVIGKDNKLIWDIPEDMQFFKQKTKGKILIMGRKTFESLPGLLPGRFHIVVSRNLEFSIAHERALVVRDLQTALTEARKRMPPYPHEVMVIGGGQIYEQALPWTDRIYLTEIDKEFSGDSYYPELNPKQFRLAERTERPGPPGFAFCTYLKL